MSFLWRYFWRTPETINVPKEAGKSEMPRISEGEGTAPWTWRKNAYDWTEKVKRELLQEIKSYNPYGGIKWPTNLLLVGPVGAGKSSFFNTVSSVFRGHVTDRALSGTTQHSLTNTFRSYKIRSGANGEPLNFTISDTMGLEEELCLRDSDFAYIMDGQIPNNFQFNPRFPIARNTAGLLPSGDLSKWMHCLIFVIDGSSIDVLSSRIVDKINSIKLHAIQREVPIIVVLTKIDKVCPLVSTDLRQVFSSDAIGSTVVTTANKLGLPINHVLPIKNYESEVESDIYIDILTLLSLKRILNVADDFIEDQLDITNEMKKLNI